MCVDAAQMLNALNAVSETSSLLAIPPWANRWLVAAIALGLAQHAAILYVPALASLFSVAPLEASDWAAVLVLSAPVLLLDEAFKALSRGALAGAAAPRDVDA